MTTPTINRREVPIRELLPADYNPRKKIKGAARQALAVSLRRFGVVQEVVVNRRPDGTLRIVGGHQRVDLLLEEGATTVPVAIVQLDDVDEKALNVALNSEHLASEWEPEMLARVLEELQDRTAQLFVDLRLDELFADAERAAAAGAPPPEVPVSAPKVPVTVLGDVWRLGDHRLVCGDSSDPEVLSRLMMGQRARLMVTDPPYNLAGESSNMGAKLAKGGSLKYGRMGKMRSAQDLADAEWDVDFKPHKLLDRLDDLLSPAAALYIFTSHFLFGAWVSGLQARHMDHVNFGAWCKTTPTPAMAKRHWTWAMELYVYATRGKHICNFPKDGHALNWWETGAKGTRTEHPTEKPIEVIQKAVLFSSKAGDLVVDPFGGSGTLVLVCEMEKRVARVCDLNPVWVDVAIEEWQRLSGKRAFLEASGRTFDEVAAERRAA